MPLQTAPLLGETINVNPGDAATQSRIFAENAARSQQNRRAQTQRPILPQVQQVGNGPKRPQAFRTRFESHPQAPQQETQTHQKMAIAVWSGGWWNETLEMLQNFAQLDGLQDRRFILVDTEMHPCPVQIIQAARNAFTEFHIYRSMDTLAPSGLSSPRTMIGLAGFIAEKLRHAGPTFFTHPIRPILAGSLDRLELEHRQSCSEGRQILGTVVGTGDERQPYGCFVAHREWIYDPNFPLAQGVGMSPEAMSPMKYMRYEMLRHFKVTSTILPSSKLAPERNTYLQAFNLAAIPRETPIFGIASPTQVATAPADDLDALIAGASGVAPVEVEQVPMQDFGAALKEYEAADAEVDRLQEEAPLELPPDDELKALVHEKGLGILAAYDLGRQLLLRAMENPKILTTLAMAETSRLQALLPPPPPKSPPPVEAAKPKVAKQPKRDPKAPPRAAPHARVM